MAHARAKPPTDAEVLAYLAYLDALDRHVPHDNDVSVVHSPLAALDVPSAEAAPESALPVNASASNVVAVTDVAMTDVAMTDVAMTDVAMTDVAMTDVAMTDVAMNTGSDSCSPPISPTRPASPSETTSGLFDEESDDEDVRPARKLRRLQRGTDSSAWHPYALPDAPDKHPGNNRKNYFDPSADWNYECSSPIVQLHDVCGKSPHRCFLVEWDTKSLQLSWVWEELLGSKFAVLISQVEEWKSTKSSDSFSAYCKKHFAGRDTASVTGGCFLDAVRAALYYIGVPKWALKIDELWKPFERDYPRTVHGVWRADATKFFRVLQQNKFPLDYERLFINALVGSYTDTKRFQEFVQTLLKGVYITSVGDGLVGHCVVVLAHDPGIDVEILDGVEPPVLPEPLHHLAYLDQVKWMSFIKLELNPGSVCRRGKRLTSTEMKKKKKLKQLPKQKRQ